jgi:hypothetical protein
MDSLKRLGDICRQHYEKLILIIALIVLGGAVWYLYMENESEKEKIKEFFTDVRRKPAKGVRPADLTNYTAALTKLQNPPALDLGLPHYLLNPVKWKESPQGLIKEVTGTESGIDPLEIINITPLNFVIAFERTAGPGYWINVTNEVAVGGNRRIAQFATLNSTNTKVFILREVKGAAEDPAELILELKESSERVTISKEKPFMRAEAYQADLRYPLENNKTFLKQRVGAQLRFGGEDYKIVAINQNEIVLLAGNDKKYTKRYNPGSTNVNSASAAR